MEMMLKGFKLHAKIAISYKISPMYIINNNVQICLTTGTAQPAKTDSDVMLCLQNYQGLLIDRLLVY